MTPERGGCINVVGYHQVTSGLGEATRRLTSAFEAAGVECRQVDVELTNSPRRQAPVPVPSDLADTTVCVVTAAELPRVLDAFPSVVSASNRMVGYWFWELSTVPPGHQAAIDLVDEIWAPTRFVHDAYAGCGRPVRLAPLPLTKPCAKRADAVAWRKRLGAHEATVLFLASVDLFSVIERKNPIGAIDAFVRAFPSRDEHDVRLVIKILNGDTLPDDLDRIMRAVATDERITVIDEHLDDAEHYALIAAADCFVSLHRSEGLGLQLAAAMWLGTVALATRYGGNVDFMDDTCAALVDGRLALVGDGRSAYPDDATWADPDLDSASMWMRRLAEQPETRQSRATNARRRMEAQPAGHQVGNRYIELLARHA